MTSWLRFQLPGWVPHRLRAGWDQRRIESALRAVLKSAPVSAVDAGQASAEVHMLLCRRDLLPGLVALKSLLKAIPHPLAVAVTSDGTLSAQDREVVSSHIPGVRWLEWPAADARLLGLRQTHPRLAAMYVNAYQPSAKLLHPILLAETERVIVVDPDTVSWRRLELLSQWVSGQVEADLHLEDLPSRIADVPASVRVAFVDFSETLPVEHRRWQMENLFFNSGLLAFRRSRMSLDVAERYLEWHTRESSAIQCPLRDIWFGPWTPEQTCFLVMFATQLIPAVPFDSEYRLGFRPEAAFNHFLRAGLVRAATLVKLREFVRARLSL